MENKSYIIKNMLTQGITEFYGCLLFAVILPTIGFTVLVCLIILTLMKGCE